MPNRRLSCCSPTSFRPILTASLLLLFAILLVGAGPPGKSKRAMPKPKKEKEPASSRSLSPDIERDLLRFRRSGGSLLDGTVFEPQSREESERAFLEALQEVARQDRRPLPTLQDAPATPHPISATSLDERLVEAFDLAAKLADEKIQRLEAEARYEEADELWKAARAMRLAARRVRRVRSPARLGVIQGR